MRAAGAAGRGEIMGEKDSPSGRDRDDFLASAGSKPPSLARELLDFIVHGKRWWLTPVLLVLALLSLFALLTGIAPVAPFIYTLF